MHALLIRKVTVDGHLVQAFRVWQRAVLNQMLDELTLRMKHTNRSIYKNRFALV